MLEKRLTLNISLGFIIGIIMGLYCKISIAFLYLLIYVIIFIIKLNKSKEKKFKLISLKRYSRYIKIIFTKKVLIIILISSIVSNSMILIQNYKYENLYKKYNDKDIICKAEIISDLIQNDYKNVYKIRVISINEEKKIFRNSKLYVYVNKKNSKKIKYGEKVIIKGVFKEPNGRRNYKGFNYKEYLKTLKIYGSINAENIESSEEFVFYTSIKSINKKINLLVVLNNLKNEIKENIKQYFDKETSALLIGILLGSKEDIKEEQIEEFSQSNILHILAVSGMHVIYIILIFNFLCKKLFTKKVGNFITSIILVVYMIITDLSPSVVRAVVSGIIVLFSEILYLRSDKWENIGTSCLILLMCNPFALENVSLILSYSATLGILIIKNDFSLMYKNCIQKIERKNEYRRRRKEKIFLKLSKNKFYKKLIEAVILTLSVNFILIPINMYYFNKINLFSLIIPIIISFIIGPIMIIGIAFIILSFTKIQIILIIISKIESNLLKIMSILGHLGSIIPCNNVFVITPNAFEILIYYISVFLSIKIAVVYSKNNLSQTDIRIKNLVNLFKFRCIRNKKRIISVFMCVIIIFSVFNCYPRNLRIYFIDVGQGDSTLLITPYNRSILIDGGGSKSSSFDVGKNTLLPYLLNRRIKKIDYLFISHFDSDHCEGLMYIIENLKIGTIIIGKKYELCDNYKKFVSIVENKKIKVKIVEAGMKINIEKDIYFNILWPDSENMISDNAINNNSLVCKLLYRNFSILFTGDIEKKAEELILSKNINLKADVLKIAHHRFKNFNNKRIFRSGLSQNSFDWSGEK